MARTKNRVTIPENSDKLITLIDLIIEKELALGPDAILSATEFTELKALRKTAFDANKSKNDLEKKAEEETKKRDLALGTAKGQTVNTPNTAKFLVTYLRDTLLAKNKTNPKALGAWGFVVDNSPKTKKTSE